MKAKKKEHACATDYLEARFVELEGTDEQQKYSSLASLFPMKYTISH
jgi:hypothetical protein